MCTCDMTLCVSANLPKPGRAIALLKEHKVSVARFIGFLKMSTDELTLFSETLELLDEFNLSPEELVTLLRQ